MKSDLSELKSSISEMKNLSSSTLGRLRNSVEDLCGSDGPEPLITFPEPESPPPPSVGNEDLKTLKFEQKRVASASKTKVVKDGFTAEKASRDVAETKRVQAGDISFQQTAAQQQRLARLEMDGVTAEKSLNRIQVSQVNTTLTS